MAQIRIRPRASEDLIEIWSYIADDSESSADAFVDKLNEMLEMLGRQPGSGRLREELAPGIRSFPCGRYVIFYVATADAIEVVRILHGARDIESIFEGQARQADLITICDIARASCYFTAIQRDGWNIFYSMLLGS